MRASASSRRLRSRSSAIRTELGAPGSSLGSSIFLIASSRRACRLSRAFSSSLRLSNWATSQSARQAKSAAACFGDRKRAVAIATCRARR